MALAPGEKKTATFRLRVRGLAFVVRENKLGVEPGDFDVMIGSQPARLMVW